MLLFLLYAIVLIHGLIHLIGFGEAFNMLQTPQFTRHVTRVAGILWLAATFFFMASLILILIQNKNWWIVLLVSSIFSQTLVLVYWHDAKYGTIPNIILIVVAVAAYGNWRFENQYQQEAALAVQNMYSKNELLLEKDIAHLPPIVQRYIVGSGALNQPKVNSFRVTFHGQMRDKGKDWFPFDSEQWNTVLPSSRHFFMKAKMFGQTVLGYHRYEQSSASMQIKLFGLIPIVDIKGKELSQAETVTLFNDMCLLAPASLIDPRIQWESIDSLQVKATFTNTPHVISANLFFTQDGDLANFISDDRYAVTNMNKYRFSTPFKQYKKVNGRHIGTYGEAIWHYPEGEFVYGKFELEEVDYNPVEKQ